MLINDEKVVSRPNNIKINDRASLTVSGVIDVDTFDEQTVVAFTDLGQLMIKGKNLHIEKLNTADGELALSGSIAALAYTDDNVKKQSFMGKLFK